MLYLFWMLQEKYSKDWLFNFRLRYEINSLRSTFKTSLWKKIYFFNVLLLLDEGFILIVIIEALSDSASIRYDACCQPHDGVPSSLESIKKLAVW